MAVPASIRQQVSGCNKGDVKPTALLNSFVVIMGFFGSDVAPGSRPLGQGTTLKGPAKGPQDESKEGGGSGGGSGASKQASAVGLPRAEGGGGRGGGRGGGGGRSEDEHRGSLRNLTLGALLF